MFNGRRQPLQDKTNRKNKSHQRVSCKPSAINTKQMKNETKTEGKQLRNRKINNYKDLLSDNLTDTKSLTDTNNHVPIYLQTGISKTSSKTKDPFQFIDTSKKNKDGSDSDSSTYDKSMQEILRNIRNREKKEKCKTTQKRIKKVNKKANVPKSKPKSKICKSSYHTPPPQLLEVAQATCSVSNDTESNFTNFFDSHQLGSPRILLTSTPNPTSINIISDIQIQPPSTATSSDIQIQPPSPATSSLSIDETFSFGCDYHIRDEETNPWRGDNLYLRRNPHWLLLKNSSLPNYNQEMILEPELIEKFTPTKPVSKKTSLVQTQIIDYTNSVPKHISISSESSLFDEHRLSPLKNKNQKESLSLFNTNRLSNTEIHDVNNCFGFTSDEEDKENVSSIKRNSEKLSPNKLKKVRKKILEPYNRFEISADKENEENVSPFKRKSSKLSPHNKKKVQKKNKYSNNYFGFISDGEDKENTPHIKKDSKKLPTRLSPRDLRKIRNEAAENLVEKVNKDNISIPVECNESVRLFEDLDQLTPVRRTYTVKKQRRCIVSADEDEKIQHKKKRKDMRTRAEEEEFNKWAKEFNAMCEEVEQHPLEISRI